MLLQVGFFKLIAIPMLAPFVLTFPGCQPLLDGLMANYALWCSMEEAAALGKGSVTMPHLTASHSGLRCTVPLESWAPPLLIALQVGFASKHMILLLADASAVATQRKALEAIIQGPCVLGPTLCHLDMQARHQEADHWEMALYCLRYHLRKGRDLEDNSRLIVLQQHFLHNVLPSTQRTLCRAEYVPPS